MTESTSEPAGSDKRTLGMGLAAVAAACLVYAALSHVWLVTPSDAESFGLLSQRECLEGTCVTTSNSAYIDHLKDTGVPDVSRAFAPMGWVTFIVCLIAALGLAGAAGLAAARKRPELRVSPSSAALLAIMVSLITGCVFVATKPHLFVGVGLAFWIFGVGAVMGIAAAQMLAKVNRPADPDLMDGAMNPEQF